MSNNPADFRIDDDATIEDADLDELNITYRGERLTEARAAELDDATARELDRRAANLIPGGKSLSGEGKHSPVVQVRVSENTRAQLRKIAAERKVSVSKLSRQVLEEFVESQLH